MKRERLVERRWILKLNLIAVLDQTLGLSAIAARGMSTFSSAKSILFQRHAALLVTNNALCLMSGLVSGT